MTATALHPELRKKVQLLANRIAVIGQKLAEGSPEQQIQLRARLRELQQRHLHVEQQLQALDREGPGFRQDVKAKLILLADDLVGAVSDLALSVDEHFSTSAEASTHH